MLAIVAGAAAVIAAPKSPPWRDDARLHGKLTIQAPRIYLGDLLERVGSQTGVSLTADERLAPIGGVQLAVHWPDVQAGDALHAVAELLTVRDDPWFWERADGGYRLRHTLSFAARAARADRELLEVWRKDLQRYWEIARMPHAERLTAARGEPRLYHPGGVPWHMVDVFSALPQQSLGRLKQGHSVHLDPASLPARARAGFVAIAPRARGAASPPAEVAFEVSRLAGHLSPIVLLRVGGQSFNVIGGMLWDEERLQSLAPGWKGPLHADVRAYARRMDGPSPPGRRTSGLTPYEALKQAAKEGLFAGVADLAPGAQGRRGTAWVGSDTRGTALGFVRLFGLQTRETAGQHLLRDPTGVISSREHVVGWSIIRELRRSAAQNGNYLDLPALRLAAGCSEAQLDGLAEEFPALEPGRFAPWQPLLTFSRRLSPVHRRRLQSAVGIPLPECDLVARRVLEAPDARFPGLEVVRRLPRAVVSLMLERVDADGPPQLNWRVSTGGRTLYQLAQAQLPREPLRPE
jgi:hypothetical protein